MIELDDCYREKVIRARIQSKEALLKLYKEFYARYVDCLQRCPKNGVSLEIGSGAGFLKDIVPSVVTTDIVSYKTVDLVMDASKMPFDDNSVNSIFMLNSLHHIPDSKSLFDEIVRCLLPGGRVLIIDQYHGWLSNIIYNYIHHEPYDPSAANWDFKSSGPLSGANGALCWIIFYRDRILFEKLYPSLKIDLLSPNTPLRYWFSGGLKWWCLLPGSLFEAFTRFDHYLSERFPSICSVLDVELVKHSNKKHS